MYFTSSVNIFDKSFKLNCSNLEDTSETISSCIIDRYPFITYIPLHELIFHALGNDSGHGRSSDIDITICIYKDREIIVHIDNPYPEHLCSFPEYLKNRIFTAEDKTTVSLEDRDTEGGGTGGGLL